MAIWLPLVIHHFCTSKKLFTRSQIAFMLESLFACVLTNSQDILYCSVVRIKQLCSYPLTIIKHSWRTKLARINSFVVYNERRLFVLWSDIISY
ncbi:hypothetical protein BC943DRAFT_319767 [Umbelopsis sp. AD052]|nr:hypothetical protein BC943DRAFT_319767 [Umbelopsis sp. AD052]